MAKNVLTCGEARIGWILDGIVDTPERSVMLQDTADRILLTVPFHADGFLRGDAADDPYAKWFVPNLTEIAPGVRAMSGDETAECPSSLIFRDPAGPVSLADCRVVSMVTVEPSGVSNGEVVANVAVIGGDSLSYGTVNGVRSELSGLFEWANPGLLHIQMKDGDNPTRQGSIHVERGGDLRLADSLGLTLHSEAFITSDGRQSVKGVQFCALVTTDQDARSWEDHFAMHNAIRDLLTISAWEPIGFTSLEAYRDDDLVRLPDGRTVDQWKTVVTHMVPPPSERPQHGYRFLVTLRDLGAQGVQKWLDLRTELPEVVALLTQLRSGILPYLGTAVLNTGIALEYVATRLARLESGHPHLKTVKGRASRLESYKIGLQVIMDSFDHPIIRDPASWISDADDCYQAQKHPDRPEPHVQVRHDTYQRNLLILRAWLAKEIGLDETTIHTRLSYDGQDNQYLAH